MSLLDDIANGFRQMFGGGNNNNRRPQAQPKPYTSQYDFSKSFDTNFNPSRDFSNPYQMNNDEEERREQERKRRKEEERAAKLKRLNAARLNVRSKRLNASSKPPRKSQGFSIISTLLASMGYLVLSSSKTSKTPSSQSMTPYRLMKKQSTNPTNKQAFSGMILGIIYASPLSSRLAWYQA